MPSCVASSFSQGLAFISSKPLRTMTVTSSPPSRREDRQQSFAVLPPPSTMTRLPILSIWPNETLDSHGRCRYGCALSGFLAARDVELAAARRAATDEDCIPALSQQRREARYVGAEPGLDPEIEDLIDLFVGHRLRQAEARDLRPHHPAALGVAVEHHAFVAERREVARDQGQRGPGPGPDQGDALAVLWSDLRHIGADIAFVVGGDALQAADRHRLLLDAAAPAGGLARPVAGAAEDAREDVRLPVDRPCLGIAPRRDQPDVFRHRRVRRAGPLAIDNLMEIVGITDIGGLQKPSPIGPSPRPP